MHYLLLFRELLIDENTKNRMWKENGSCGSGSIKMDPENCKVPALYYKNFIKVGTSQNFFKFTMKFSQGRYLDIKI